MKKDDTLRIKIKKEEKTNEIQGKNYQNEELNEKKYEGKIYELNRISERNKRRTKNQKNEKWNAMVAPNTVLFFGAEYK